MQSRFVQPQSEARDAHNITPYHQHRLRALLNTETEYNLKEAEIKWQRLVSSYSDCMGTKKNR